MKTRIDNTQEHPRSKQKKIGIESEKDNIHIVPIATSSVKTPNKKKESIKVTKKSTTGNKISKKPLANIEHKTDKEHSSNTETKTKKIVDKSIKETHKTIANKKESKAVNKKSAITVPMGNMAPAAFSKAAFEEQVNLAIRESISRQKEQNRVYNQEIISNMKSIISNYTESPELLDNIENNTDVNFVEKLNIDSVDFVEIIVDAEEVFKIKMEDEEIKALRSFDDLYDLIETKTNLNNTPIKKQA